MNITGFPAIAITDSTESGRARLRQNALGLWDFWLQDNFHSNVSGIYVLALVGSGGSLAFGAGNNQFQGFNFSGIALRSGTTANSGATVGSQQVAYFFGQIPLVYRVQFSCLTFTDLTFRAGFHSSTTSADSTDGAYFELLGSTLSAKTANNSTRTTHPTTVTLATDTIYTAQIEVSTVPEARFRLWSGTNETAIYDETISTNLPTTTQRRTMVRATMTNSGTVPTTMMGLFSMGVGTANGFARARL